MARDAFAHVYARVDRQIPGQVESHATEVDWLVKESFSVWVESFPGIHRVFKVPSQVSLFQWIQVIRTLQQENYDVIIDLHRTLRTFVLRLTWRVFSPGTRIEKISKERLRLWGLFCFKRLWPKSWSPTPWFNRYIKILEKVFVPANTGSEIQAMNQAGPHLENKAQIEAQAQRQSFFVLMPSSRWPGKEWPVAQYVQLIEETQIKPVILGQKNDSASSALVESLKEKKISFDSLVGASVQETMNCIQNAIAYVGADTGLAHLSESLGTPVFMILGPTTECSGFPPRLSESKTFGSALWCRPCSKDGRGCFRLLNRYRCLNDKAENDWIRSKVADEIRILLRKNKTEKKFL